MRCRLFGSDCSPLEAVKSIAKEVLIPQPLRRYSMKLGFS